MREEEREAAGNDQYYDNSSLSHFIRPRPPSLPPSTLLATLARARKRVSTLLALPPAPPEARMAAAMFRRRGRGLPVARGNQRYPDIDLGATRRVARLLSGRENVITALWWLR